jgi:replicative DNA helicase
VTDALPHSEPLEAALVARLLVDPAQLPVIAGKLGAEDFYVASWRKAYLAMQKLSAARKTIDIEGLRAAVGDDADELGRRLGELTAAHRAPLTEYADMVRSFAFRRRFIGMLSRVTSMAQSESSPETLLSNLNDAIQRISEGMEDGALLTPNQAVDLYKRTMTERASGERQGMTWGVDRLDDLLLPARGGEFILVAARPSIGKTVLAEQIADHWARLGPHPVIFASLEMPTDSLLDRTVSRLSGIPGMDVIRGLLSQTDTDKALSTLEGRRSVGLWYLDDSYATTSSLRAAAARVRLLAGGVSAIVVDYLQLLKDQHESEVTRVTRISRQLKALAREFNVPVLVLSQLNRAPEMREDSHPRLSDLRDSGALEQDADRVLGLWRPTRSSTLAHLDVLKARQGVTGRISLAYDGEHFQFRQPVYGDETEEVATEAADDMSHFS